MPNLTTPPAGSSLKPEQLAAAERLIAAELGLDTLAETPRAESGRVGSSGKIYLRYPAVSIQSLSLGGAPAAGVLDSPRTLDVSSLVRNGYGDPWGSPYGSTPYAIQYTSGWTADTLPGQIVDAVLAVAGAAAALEGREGVVRETMGPVTVQYAEGGSTGLTADVLNLLQFWRPLRL